MNKSTEKNHHLTERNYLFATSSFIIIIHLTQVLNFKFQNFPLLSFINIACIFAILFFNYLFQKNKNLKSFIDQIIICENLNIFFSSIFIWKFFPEVFIWHACIFLVLLLFYEGKKLRKYFTFSFILFVSAPIISEIFRLDDYFASKTLKLEHYKEFLYITIIGATILLIFIVAGFKKYLYLNSEYYNPPSNSDAQNKITDVDKNIFLNITEKETSKGSDLEQLFIKIKKHVETEKKYLDTEYSLRTLSLEIGSNISYVSKSINIYSKYNFSDFINKYRIEYFKHLVENEDNFSYIKKHYAKCGFKQQSTFNRVFKQFEGITPTQYLKKIKH